MHWCSWDSLCKAKDEGDLGFRDLGAFNKAMLAKQSWRLIHNPNSLVARVMKSCYSQTSFLDAKKSSSGSFLWSSLVWGRKLVEKGSRWRVGTVLGEWSSVDSLKLQNGSWNDVLVRQSFSKEDAEAILTSRMGIHDSLLWHYDKSGTYSVKSGYWFAKNMDSNPSCSGLNPSVSWWKFLWRLCLPTKIKIFIWKACNDWIPTNVNLAVHGVKVEKFCPFCRRKAETSLHALWGCSFLNGIRSGSGIGADGKVLDSASFLDFVLYCRDINEIHKLEILCVDWWRIWFRTNKWVPSRSLVNVGGILNCAEIFIQDIQIANRREGGPSVHRLPSKWLVPPVVVFKINSDAALRDRGKVSGIGVVIRDWNGHVMASLCQNVRGVLQPQVLEAMAILHDCNNVAHSLAKLALDMEGEAVWLEDRPLLVESLVLGDCPSAL
ncbi:hypothetical protein Dsin_019157 [Dipteronia sinensis]|uniref:Reverse transcriptase zinc-binding domain-containing protein n=1 Tax=Dipteronia sinensis TaxID=43782 RepID=A0AAE0A864_9ROSI|nr:hypothetical protein Dsin_019157 [Dipteronia sinensis]